MVHDTKSLLGETLIGLGQFEEAEVLVVDAFESMTPPADASDRSLNGRKEYDESKRAAAQRIVQLYEAWERPEAADSARALYAVQD